MPLNTGCLVLIFHIVTPCIEKDHPGFAELEWLGSESILDEENGWQNDGYWKPEALECLG